MSSGHKKIIMILCGLLVLPLAARADVFTLWPFSPDRNDGTMSTASMDKVFDAKNFWREDIVVNGSPMTLNVALLETDRPFTELARLLIGRAGKGVAVSANANSLLMQEPQADGSMLRRYYLQLSGVSPVLLFQIVLPKDRHKCGVEDWPADLPFIMDATELVCMKFPARDAVYGSFTVQGAQVQQVMNDLSARIMANGWSAVSQEVENLFEGSGEVFLKEDPQAVFILGIAPMPGNSGVKVSMYTRKL